MPELPEVEIVRQSLNKKIKLKKIRRVIIRNRNLRFKIPSEFERKLHKKVIYGSSEMKKDREKEGYITFQVANELSRIKENFQLEVYEFITKNHIHGWQDVKSIKELLVINDYKNSF